MNLLRLHHSWKAIHVYEHLKRSQMQLEALLLVAASRYKICQKHLKARFEIVDQIRFDYWLISFNLKCNVCLPSMPPNNTMFNLAGDKNLNKKDKTKLPS